MVKKLIPVLMLLCIVISLSACTNAPAPTTEPTAVPEEVISEEVAAEDSGEASLLSQESWLLDTVPAFDGGVYAQKLFSCGQGLNDPSFSSKNDSQMMVISEVSAEQFGAYCEKMKSSGFDETFANERDGNLFREFWNGSERVYTSYLAASQTCRVILDKNSTQSCTDFGYTYDDPEAGSTVVYQYGLPYIHEPAHWDNYDNILITADGGKWINCGMCYIIKLADDGIVVIDGGDFTQFDDAQIDGMMSFLREITGTSAPEKIRIAGWFITHTHRDHFGGFCRFVGRYADELSLERVFCNFPGRNNLFRGKSVVKLMSYMWDDLGGTFEYLKLHTGESFTLADVTFDILYTHEDCVKSCGETAFELDINDTSTVIRVGFDGKYFLVLGDISQNARSVLVHNNSDETLKSDLVQLAHHGLNDLTALYRIVQAGTVFVPNSRQGAAYNRNLYEMMKVVSEYAPEERIFYAQEGTAGLAVIDGELVQVYSRPVDGGAYGDWGW